MTVQRGNSALVLGSWGHCFVISIIIPSLFVDIYYAFSICFVYILNFYSICFYCIIIKLYSICFAYIFAFIPFVLSNISCFYCIRFSCL